MGKERQTMARALKCLRCGAGMQYVKTEKLQLGQTSWIFGDWPNLIAGAMEVDIYACPSCGKLELFQTEPAAEPLQIWRICVPAAPGCWSRRNGIASADDGGSRA